MVILVCLSLHDQIRTQGIVRYTMTDMVILVCLSLHDQIRTQGIVHYTMTDMVILVCLSLHDQIRTQGIVRYTMTDTTSTLDPHRERFEISSFFLSHPCIEYISSKTETCCAAHCFISAMFSNNKINLLQHTIQTSSCTPQFLHSRLYSLASQTLSVPQY